MNLFGHKFGHQGESKPDFSKTNDPAQYPADGLKINAPRAVENNIEQVAVQANAGEQAVAGTVEVTPVTNEATTPSTELPSVPEEQVVQPEEHPVA